VVVVAVGYGDSSSYWLYCDHGNAIKIAEKKNTTVSYEYYFLKKFVRD
jgi:hypothetical protein